MNKQENAIRHGLNLLSSTCVCYTCKQKFERLSTEWRYKAVIRSRVRWFCSWGCFREATAKQSKNQGARQTAEAL